jgi:hypothetical protein
LGAAVVCAALIAVAGLATARSAIVVEKKTVHVPPSSQFATDTASTTCPDSNPTPGFLGFSATLAADTASGPGVLPLALTAKHSRASARAINPGTQTGTLTVTAYCERDAGKVTTATASKSLSASPTTATVHCPKKTHLLDGAYIGHTTADSAAVPIAARSSNPRTWKVTAVQFGNSPAKITAIARCARVPAAREIAGHASVPAETDGVEATARCPKGSQARFGGFAGEVAFPSVDPAVFPTGLARVSSRLVKATATNGGATEPGQLQVFAYCG